jgi:hypothetical protein
MAESRQLPEMLDLLEATLRSHGAVPVLDRLRPGLSPPEMDALVEPLGLALPQEAKHWWAWHDGSSSTFNIYALTPLFSFLPLAKAVAEAEQLRRRWPDPALDEYLLPWPATWLPVGLSDVGTVTTIECSTVDAALAPVVVRSWHTDLALPEATAPSMAEMVADWIQALESGVYRFDETGPRWHRDWALMSPEVEAKGYV